MAFIAKVFDPKNLIQDYGDAAGEVTACREHSAVFDFSFISVARVSGANITKFFAQLTDRNLNDLEEGRIRYALCRCPDGWLRSDLTIWKVSVDNYLVMSGLGQDLSDLADTFDIQGEDVVVYSVQGPRSLEALDGLTDLSLLKALPYFGFAHLDVAGVKCNVGRLGYTGELGFEIVAPVAVGDQLWRKLLTRIRPAGFTAANCLRIEAGFVLFTNEFRLPVTAEEAGLKAFAGDDPVPSRYQLVCFRAESLQLLDKGINSLDLVSPKSGTITVTSACQSATASGILGLGYVPKNEAIIGQKFFDPTGLYKDIRMVDMPFYDTKKHRPRIFLA